MKKLIVALFVIVSSMSSAQDESGGKFVIEPMIGIPNAGRIYGAFLDDVIFNQDDTYKITGTPVQLGGRVEYVTKSRIGIGFEVNYEKSGYERTYTDYYVDPITMTYSEKVEIWNQKKIRFLGRFMYHFGEGENLTWYTGAALGYTHEEQDNPLNEPDWSDYSFAFFPKLIDRVSDPISARVYFGMKYMFTNNIGLVTEVGIGSGSPILIGLSANFGK